MALRVSNVTSQVLFVPSEIFQSVSDTISFIQEPFARKVRVSNLTIQILQLEAGRLLTVSDTLNFVDGTVVVNSASDRQVIEDVINFQQTVFVPSHPSIVQTINFVQNARSSIHNIDLSQNLFLKDDAIFCNGAPWLPILVEDTISFVQFASKTETVAAINVMALVDEVSQVQAPIGDGHFIDFQQSVSVGFGYDVSSQIEFTQQVDTFSDFLRTVVHADILDHSMTYFIDNGCNRKQYARFVGEGDADAIREPNLVFESSFVLESISTGTVVILRSPETDDNERLGFSRINRESRGGELNVFSDPIWGQVNTLLFTITALPDGKGNCPDTLELLLTFLQDNLGQEIYLHDWTGTSWRGVITAPSEAATEDDEGYWTVSFEFEGIPEDGSVPNSVLDITDSVTFNADWNRPLEDTLNFSQEVTVGGDINISVSDTLELTDSVDGTQEITVMEDDHTSGVGTLTLDGRSPDVGTGTWRSHTEFLDDGTLNSPIDAGAYYQFSPVDGTVYELTFNSANVLTYSDANNCIFGFFEDESVSNVISGPSADGTLNPTAAKAVHLMREVNGGQRNNSYRRGTDSDGTADTLAWTDGTLKTSPDSVLDLRLLLDTTGGPGNWTATWQAKSVISPNYTEVGPETELLSENVGAVGWSMDTTATDCTLDKITLKELRPV